MVTQRDIVAVIEAMAVALAHIRDTVPPLPSDIPAPVSALVNQMLEKDPALRPASRLQLTETGHPRHPFSTTVRPVALSEVAQIIGYVDVLWHPVVALTAFPSSLHNVGQDFADSCYRFSAFPREVSYLFG
jgi:hypothetical protein